MSYVLKERVGFPVWDGEYVKDIKHFMPYDTVTDQDFEDARQDDDEKKMLIEHNCFTDAEIESIDRLRALPDLIAAATDKADSMLTSEDEQARTDAWGELQKLRAEEATLREEFPNA